MRLTISEAIDLQSVLLDAGKRAVSPNTVALSIELGTAIVAASRLDRPVAITLTPAGCEPDDPCGECDECEAAWQARQEDYDGRLAAAIESGVR